MCCLWKVDDILRYIPIPLLLNTSGVSVKDCNLDLIILIYFLLLFVYTHIHGSFPNFVCGSVTNIVFLVAQWWSICQQFKSFRRCSSDPWVREIPWRRAWQPTQVFLPGELHGQRSRAGYIVHRVAQSQTELKWLHMHTHTRLTPLRLTVIL